MGLLSTIGHAFAKTYWREEPIVSRLRPHLLAARNVLDIGAGGCRVAKLLAAPEGVDITAIDVVDHNVTDMPLVLYNGKILPFADKTFDVSLLVFVLHHAAAPDALLREAARVTRSTILVVEDAPGNPVERILWRAWDYLLNHGAHDDIDVAHGAQNTKEWTAFLEGACARPTSTATFRTWFPVLRTYPHTLFALNLDQPVTAGHDEPMNGGPSEDARPA